MPLPPNAKKLLSGVVENARVEFKETWEAEAALKITRASDNRMDNWGGGHSVGGGNAIEAAVSESSG